MIDAFYRYIVGWQVTKSLRAESTLTALEQALRARDPAPGLVHRSDHGVQYLAIRGNERLSEAGALTSVGEVVATPTATRGPKPSSACSRPSSCAGAAPGGAWKTWICEP